MAIKARWIRDDSATTYIEGVPQRDLTDEEYEALSLDRREAILGATNLYIVEGVKKANEVFEKPQSRLYDQIFDTTKPESATDTSRKGDKGKEKD